MLVSHPDYMCKMKENGRTAKASFLCTVSLQFEALSWVADVVCCNWRVVRDLFDYEICLATTIYIWPITEEQSTA